MFLLLPAIEKLIPLSLIKTVPFKLYRLHSLKILSFSEYLLDIFVNLYPVTFVIFLILFI